MKLSDIAVLLECDIPAKCANIDIKRIASLESADEQSITFLSNPKFSEDAKSTRAAAIIVKKDCTVEGKINLEVEDPYVGYALVARLFEDRSPVFEGGTGPGTAIDKTAKIHPSVNIGPGTIIGKNVVIDENTTVGAGCIIEKGTVVGKSCRIDSGSIVRWNTIVGNNVIIQSGAVIGSDGFANAMHKGKFIRIPCFGRVVIEDDVNIGANTTIDRGNFEPTVIHAGVRLDNLIHIAHNVSVGDNTAIAAQTGVSGSTKIGKGVIIGGQAGFVGHINIGDGSFIGAKAGISKGLEPGSKVTGYPARDLMKMRRIEAAQLSLPEMVKEIKRLKGEVEKMRETIRELRGKNNKDIS